ncbi:MAG: hypothetical protein JXL80_03290, partial [Planctomycetes bacterium]|nr:hypothetical protein [Planctomycetota bacterium]
MGRYSMRVAMWLVTVGMVLGVAGVVRGGDYYVSPKGDDAASGASDATAFRTLQKAADVVKPG